MTLWRHCTLSCMYVSKMYVHTYITPSKTMDTIDHEIDLSMDGLPKDFHSFISGS